MKKAETKEKVEKELELYEPDPELDKAFEEWQKKVEELVKEHPLQIISWEATRRCNLKCVHCGTPAESCIIDEELNTEEVIGAFYQIKEDFDLNKFHHINITGGEPFVRKDLVTILREISKIPKFRNIAIQTNGICIAENPEILTELKDYGVTGIGVSIDGLEKTHDSFRNKNGCWKKAMEAAKKACEEGYTVTISVVAHSKNIDEIPKLYNLIQETFSKHPRYFRVMTIDPLGRADLNREYLLGPDDVRKVVKWLEKQYEKDFNNYWDPSVTIVELGCGGWLGKKLEGRVRPYIFHCIAGVNNLGILYDGKLASCTNVSREFIEGDLRKDRIKYVWENEYKEFRNRDWVKKSNPYCKECSEWEYCHGGPMHKLTKDGRMLDCLYKTIFYNVDFRKELPEKIFTIPAGN